MLIVWDNYNAADLGMGFKLELRILNWFSNTLTKTRWN